jgi:hypothetical protein
MKNKYLLLITITVIVFVTTTIAQNVPSYVPTNGLIGWWPFNGNANDESANNNNGTNNGATLTTDRFGHADSAYLFDGLSSYISIPSSASLESPTKRLTISAWVNLAGYSLVGQTLDPILDKSDNSGNSFMYHYEIDLNGSGFYIGVNNWTNNIGTAYNFSFNRWYMLSIALDSSVAYIYRNDTLVTTQSFITNITRDGLPLEIGRDVPGVTEVFNGKIDDIGIWNRALSQHEISNLYNNVNTGIKEPLIANQLKIYPNPASHQINIEANTKIAGSSFIISDPLGKIIITGKLNEKNTIINVDGLTTGIYVLRVGPNVKQRFNILKN